MSEPSVTVTLGKLGAGEREVELGAGDSLEETFGGPAYIKVEVAEGSEDTMLVVADTEMEQDDGGERVVDDPNPRRQCDGCGTHYSMNYSRCPECGNPNPDA